jgi:hypothetical protein
MNSHKFARQRLLVAEQRFCSALLNACFTNFGTTVPVVQCRHVRFLTRLAQWIR